MEKQETIAQKAHRLLKDVPEDKWVIGLFTDLKSKCCAIGHYERLTSDNPNDYSRPNCLDYNGAFRAHTRAFLSLHSQCDRYDIAYINNGDSIRLKEGHANKMYLAAGPKRRTILFLEWMISEGW